ncbi:MAG: enoyl-CoA hydratase-related protein [Deltaproteobacteria bacterium]|nr:enoyl-CoA hydratase-related protein [Deltaproteobacteria bacterium]
MANIRLGRDGAVFILTMQAGENRFNPAFITAMNQALDQVEGSSGSAALVTTGGEEKFFSNGLDLGWLMGEGKNEWKAFIPEVLKFLGRLMAFPAPTVAAMNGHAFAAGAMMALAHDYRVMRADRGFFCLPEVDIKIPLAPGMNSLIKCRLSPAVFRDAVLTGKRIGGSEAKGLAIVDEAVPLDQVLPKAVEIAAGLAAKDRKIFGALKREMYRETIDLLERGMVDWDAFSP